MIIKKGASPSDSSRTKSINLKKASMVIDNFAWTLQNLDFNQLKAAADLFRFALAMEEKTSSVARTYQSTSPNKHFLIGVLPRLFQDKELFPQNDDIADFAKAALQLEMSRPGKRSRYEIIGMVVCETDSLSEAGLTMLVQALEKLAGNKEKLAQVAEKKRTNSFSWNETLQDLLRE